MAGKPLQDVVVAEVLHKEAAVAEMLLYNLVWVVQANRFQFMRTPVLKCKDVGISCFLLWSVYMFSLSLLFGQKPHPPNRTCTCPEEHQTWGPLGNFS